MRISSLARKAPVKIDSDATIAEAARLMDAGNVGALLVMDGEVLVGIVTDRDLAVRGVARRLAPDARIDGVMSMNVITVDEDADVHDSFDLLGQHGVRRLPVLRGTEVVGMLTVDDLLVSLSSELGMLVHPIVGELAFGHHPVPAPAIRSAP